METEPASLKRQYLAYIDCLNRQDWQRLGNFVHEDAAHNGVAVGLAGYRQMLEGDFASIPDLRFDVALLTSEPPYISSRLRFDCTPVGTLFGLAVNGRRVQFHENVFYRFLDGRIHEVWSIIDKAEIAAQL
ncbi:ester cyclase [Devosia soli]|uniref:Ester cyclase n=1 Tax=Devosia soli TaxID=361041 RepID=A0A0F5L701_9HYPH|nr:ester cyclase [Devosia soli]KKB77989.1 ester cyclase [Devosia soli]